MYGKTIELIDRIEQNIKNKKGIIGFDGCIDKIVRPILKNNNENFTYFSNLKQFGEYINKLDCLSNAIELELINTKIGGNNPIMALGLSRAGIQMSSIGTFGQYEVEKEFRELENRCKLYSLGNPGQCISYEFGINKLMTFININRADITYEKVIDIVGKERLVELFEGADLITLVNYSEMPWISTLWKKLLLEVFPKLSKQKIIFFDLSDCSRLDEAQLKEAITLIQLFKPYGKVYLGLNENEFLSLYQYVTKKKCIEIEDVFKDSSLMEQRIRPYLERMYEEFSIECIILRTLHKFFAYSSEGVISIDNRVNPSPNYLTGCGDNQGVGICVGLLANCSIKEALEFGSIVGNYYIEFGKSPTLNDLRGYIQ